MKAQAGTVAVEIYKKRGWGWAGEELKRYMSGLISERSFVVDKGIRKCGNNYTAT